MPSSVEFAGLSVETIQHCAEGRRKLLGGECRLPGGEGAKHRGLAVARQCHKRVVEGHACHFHLGEPQFEFGRRQRRIDAIAVIARLVGRTPRPSRCNERK